MGCLHNFICYFSFSLIFLLILSSTQLRFPAEGREISKPFSQTVVSEDKSILRGQIGSRPPRCERRCSSCAHCEAIQVPANPQVQSWKKNDSSKLLSNFAYGRDDDNSNYKPMSWKCKCGNFIFNP